MIPRIFTLLTLTLVLGWTVPDARAQAETNGAPAASSLKFGLYIHFGIATFTPPGDKDQVPASSFAPTALDVSGWVRAAKEAGMTFAVLTAKHDSGFCLWDSPGYDYDVAQSPYKGDIIGDFIAACNAAEILPGIHYSIPDSYNEGEVRNRGPVANVYFELIKKHLTELQTRYPGLRLLVVDAGWRLSPAQREELRQLMTRLNPQCVVWDTVFGAQAPYTPDTIIGGWMWSPGAPLSTARQLFDHYQKITADGRAFLLNVGPDTSGAIPENQLAVLRQVKALIDESTAPITAETLKRGLILDFDFDQEAVGGKIPDLSGKGNDGVAMNVQWIANGHSGGSVQFDKQDSYITVANNASLNPTEMTLSAWIKTSYTDRIWRRIFDKATGVGYDLTMCGNDQKGHSWQGQFALEGGPQWSVSRVRVDDGRWHMVTGTFDGATLQNYVDGQPVGRGVPVRKPPARTIYDLTIGANRSNPDATQGEVGPSFYGAMDDVMMYNRALSAREVKALYNTQKAPTDVPLATTIAPPPQKTPAPSSLSPSERLQQLKTLYDQGLIDHDQYNQKVKAIVDSL